MDDQNRGIDVILNELKQLQNRYSELEELYQKQSLEIEKYKLVDLELRESEEKLKIVLDNSLDGIVMLDLKSEKCVYVNPVAEEISGFSVQDLNSLDKAAIYEHLHPDDRKDTIHRLKQVASGQALTTEGESRYKAKDGSYRWANIQRKLVYNSHGRPSFIIVIIRDITLHKQRIEERYNSLMENAPFPIFVTQINDDTLCYINQRAQIQLDLTENVALGTQSGVFFQDQTEYNRMRERLQQDGEVTDQEISMLDHRGRPFIASLSASTIQFEGEASNLISINDITARHQAENGLKSSEEKYRLITENASDVIWVLNLIQNRFTYISPSIQQLRGYTVEEALAQNLEEALTPESVKIAKEIVTTNVSLFQENPNTQSYITEVQQPCKNGDIIWVEISTRYRFNSLNEIEVVGVSRDITERKRKEEELLYFSMYDSLTGLMNQTALRQKVLSKTPDSAIKSGWSAIFINLDNFRIINEALSHDAGDRTIVETAQSISSCIGNKGTVYRYSGDEFIIITGSNDFNAVYDLAKDVLDSISTQMYIAKRFFYLTASIGVYLGNEAESLDKVIKNAYTALYIAKKQKNTISFYTPAMDQIRTRESMLEDDMSSALENEEFELYFQPIVDIKKGIINQAEALLRWNHPEFGQVSPAEFIPIAERTKLILPISDWIIKTACSKLAEWGSMEIPPINLSINLSLTCFENRGHKLTEHILYTINEFGIDPSHLKLEVTESMLIQDPKDIMNTLERLKSIGVGLALDDFGTGYSSFGYLKDLPLDVIKIDRSLISTTDADRKGLKLVQSLISIIQGLELEVIAEGVETVSQFKFLKDFDCNFIQGYLFSRPLPNQQFIDYCFAMKEPGKVLRSIP